ncbi:Sak single strand annealing protein [Staphylococcus xylosus]|uniref:Sak single strand annealing protein n=1 Tax=Staphylococcus xylosus TaxID=1288 RepID=UPI003F9AF186
MSEQSLFEQLNQLNVNEHVDKKNGLSYLSWSYAHQELKKIDPNYTVKVHEYPHPEITTEQYFVPYLATPEGYSVTVSITIKGQTETETLPVLDFKNKAVPYKQVDMFQINKTYKRCFVKAAALHGLGLYIYNGDVMPEQPFEAASDSEIKEVDEKVKVLAPLMNLTESQLKNKMNIPNKLSTTDAEEAIIRLDNGIQYYKKNEKDDK